MICNGVSLSTKLGNNKNLIRYMPEGCVIELPCEEKGLLEEIIDVCIDTNHPYSLHYPSYASYSRIGFSDVVSFEKIIADIESYYHTYTGADYFVCHFPLHSITTTEIDPIVLNDSAQALSSIRIKQVPLLIENISIVQNCNRSETYKQLFADSEVNFCLDLGHAFLVNRNEPIAFLQSLKHRIYAIHYYNTADRGSFCGKHLPCKKYKKDVHMMNMDVMDKMIGDLTNLRWVIDESQPT